MVTLVSLNVWNTLGSQAFQDHVRTQFPVEKLVEVADHNRIIPSEKLYEPSEPNGTQQANVEDAIAEEKKIPSKI